MIKIRDGRIGLLFVVALLLSVACQGTKNAYKAAEGLDETAKVVLSHYAITLHELNALKATGGLSGAALAKAQGVVRVTTPLMAELSATAQSYESVRSAKNELDLQIAISKAVKQLSHLIDLLKGSKPLAWRPDPTSQLLAA